MKEFAHSTGAFASGWKDNEGRRVQLVESLATIIDETVMFGTAMSVTRTVFDEVNREYEFDAVFKNAFVFVARECAETVKDWLMGSRGWYPDRHPSVLRHVFDRGEDGRGALVDLFHGDGLPTPSFEPSRDDDKTGQRGVLPLQAADFAAYEYFRLFKTLHDEWDKWPRRIRQPGESPFPETRRSGDRIRKNVDALDHESNAFWLRHRCEERGIPKRVAP